MQENKQERRRNAPKAKSKVKMASIAFSFTPEFINDYIAACNRAGFPTEKLVEQAMRNAIGKYKASHE